MAREIKQTLLELITKHNQLYKFTTRGNLKTNSRRVKEGRTKARTRKMKRMSVNIDKILSIISPSYRSGGVVTDLDLNKVQLLQLRQVKWIKAILRSEKLPKNVRSEFLQNLKAVVHKAIAEDLSKSEDDSRVIVKKSSPKNLSVDCRSTVGRHITDSLPTGYRQLTDRLPTVSQRRKLLRKHALNMT